MIKYLYGFLCVVAVSSATGQILDENPFLKESDARVLAAEAEAFMDAAAPLTKEASQSTVGIHYRGRRLSYGTVVGDKLIATKLSEIAAYPSRLVAVAKDGKLRRLHLVKSVDEHDLALLSFVGPDLPVLKMGGDEGLKAGDLLFFSRPDNVVVGAGVVSVLPRSLRHQDKGFLGIGTDRRQVGKGVTIDTVQKGSAAAMAGLLVGDVIFEIASQEINGFEELSATLKRKKPGDVVEIVIERDGKRESRRATLTALNEVRMPTPRFQHMEEMGSDISQRRDGFSRVIQSDIDLRPVDMGGPVVNLEGKAVGLMLARASRIKSHILPSDVINGLLKELKKD